MDENVDSIEFSLGADADIDAKQIGGKLGPKIGAGLRKPPPGMVFIDITGAIDGDADGIVFESTPFERPIIPRATIPKDQALRQQNDALTGAIANEKRRTGNVSQDLSGSRSRSGDSNKKRNRQRKLTPDELRKQQEEKLRAQTIPKKRKPGPDKREWDEGSRSQTARRESENTVSPVFAKIVDDYLDIYPPVGSKSRTGGRSGKTYPKKSKEEKLDALTKFLADSLIAALEESKDGKWKRPWKSLGLYRNGKTGKPYKGSNQAILAMVAEVNNYNEPIWLTYKQAQELGGQVRKGEKGTMLSYWKRSSYAVAGPDGEVEEKERWMSSFFTVFNIDQIDGIDPSRFPKPEVLPEETRIESIQQIIDELDVAWREGGDRAYNSPMEDRVQMPPFASFDSPEAFYATLMHEVVHWTGNPGRLDRPKMNSFGSPEYAYEELIAEIGSSMLMAVLGLESRPDEQHVQYIKSWLQALKNDPGQVSQAAAAAQKAIDWLVEKSPTLKAVFDKYYPPIADIGDDENDGEDGVPDIGDTTTDRRWDLLSRRGGKDEAPDTGNITPDESITPQQSTNSWDYDSYGIPGSKSSTSKPEFPRKPPAPAFSGRAAEIIKDARTWDEFWEKMGDEEVIFVDYETTGLVWDEFKESSSNGLPTQLGAVRMRNGKVIDRFNIYMNPGMPHSAWEEWSRDNLKDADGNPVTQDFVDRQISIADAHRMFTEWAGDGVILGMQNATFDNEVLGDALRESGIDWEPDGILDTKEIADATLPRWTEENQDGPFKIDRETGQKVPSNSLGDVTKYLGVKLGDKHHTADYDAAATGEVFTRIVELAIEKGWSTDALDPAKREAKEKQKQEQFDIDIAKFRKKKDEWLNAQNTGQSSASDEDGISLEIDGPGGSKSTTRRWDSISSQQSQNSPLRKGATHIDARRLREGDALPDNWDRPDRKLGDPRWVVRSVRPNPDGTLSVTLSDSTGESDLVDVIFEKDSVVPNVSRPLNLALDFPVVDDRIETTQPKWNSPQVIYRRNASSEATEFSLFDNNLPPRVSPFSQKLFERGNLRSSETEKLNDRLNRFTLNGVEESMQFIARKAKRDNTFGIENVQKELQQLRNDISFSGLFEGLSNDIIADLIEGTYTGDAYKELNDTMRRRGFVSTQTRRPVGSPLGITGSKSTTRADGRTPLPTGEIVRTDTPVGRDGGFWRADYGDSLFEDAQEEVAYSRERARNRLLADRLAELSPDDAVELLYKWHIENSVTAEKSKKTVNNDVRKLQEVFEIYDLGNGKLLFIQRGGTNQMILEPDKSGDQRLNVSSVQSIFGGLLRSARTPSMTNVLPELHSRYKANLKKIEDLIPGFVFAIDPANRKKHIRLWLLDEFGFPVSVRNTSTAWSPGRDDSVYIANYILAKEILERFQTARGRLSANQDYLMQLIPFIKMPDVNSRVKDRSWIGMPPLSVDLADSLIWQIDIPLDSGRNPVSNNSDIATNLQIDVYEVRQPNGSRAFRVIGQAVTGPGFQFHEIEVDFPTRESAIAYALSEASPYPYHAWAMNIDAAARRLPEGLDQEYIIDKELKKILAGDRTLSKMVGMSGSRSTTGKQIYFDSYGIAENYILSDGDVSDERFDSFINELRKVNNRSSELMRLLEDELAKSQPNEQRIFELEKAMKVHDLITGAVADALIDMASKNRQWRLRKTALAVAKKMLIDELRSGKSEHTETEVRRIVQSLDDDAVSMFGGITSQYAVNRIAEALSVLGEIGWPESFAFPLSADDNLGPDGLQQLISSPTDEIISAARKILDIEKMKSVAERSRKRRDYLQDIESNETVSGYRPLLLGNPMGGSASRTKNVSLVNGRGLGDSRIIFPKPGSRNTGGAVDEVYYDGARQELEVRFAGGSGVYVYGGIGMGVADKLERSFGIGRDINSIINNGEYSYLIKPNGDTDGSPITLPQLLRADIERLGKYSDINSTLADEIEFLLNSLENNPERISRMEEPYFDNLSYRLWATASILSQTSGEHSAANHLLELINLVDEFRSSGLAGRASSRNRMPLRDKTTLNLNSDELGEIRQEVRDALRANPDDPDIAILAEFEDKIKKSQEGNSPLVLKQSEHKKYAIAFDRLFAKANNKEIDNRFTRTVAESLLNLSAFSGKYDSPRIDSGGGFRGRPYNSGAPSTYNPDELIFWARKQRSFRVVQSLVARYDSNGGILTAAEWVRLGGYHDNSLRRSPRSGPSSKSTTQSRLYGSRSSTGPVDVPSPEPSNSELVSIESESGDGKKKKPKPPQGKPISEIFGDRLDGLSPEEQIDALFSVGVATTKNKDGINPQEFEAKVRELETQRLALELMEEEQAMRAAIADAVRRGVEFNEEEWYEGYARAREQRRQQVIDQYMSDLMGDDLGKRTAAERFLGVTREDLIKQREDQRIFKILDERNKKKEDARKTQTSYPLPELIKKLRRAAQVRSGALAGATDGDEEQHRPVWDNIIRVLEELEGDVGSSLTPDIVLDQIADMLQDYETSIFDAIDPDAIDPDRSSSEQSSEARRSISAARQWRDVVRNSLDAAESEEDDDIPDDEDDDGTNPPIAGSKSTTASNLFYQNVKDYKYGTDPRLDKLVSNPKNWTYDDTWGQKEYQYIGEWPDINGFTFPLNPPEDIRSRISRRELTGPEWQYAGEGISVHDRFPTIPDDFKHVVFNGIHMGPRLEPRLEFDFALPGSMGERNIEIPNGKRPPRRYRRRRPSWRYIGNDSNPALSQMSDDELKMILNSIRAWSAVLEIDDIPRPRYLMGSSIFNDPISMPPRRTEPEYGVDDIIAELDRRGYYVYENEATSGDPDSDWYVVKKSDATPEEIDRRIDGSWRKKRDDTTLPNDRVQPDGEREIEPIDYVVNIINSGDAEANEKAIIDLIDNSDINDMSLDDVNAEILNIRDELEDIRQRANAGTISRQEYNQRRRELNRRKQMLLQKKHGNKDSARNKAQGKRRPVGNSPRVIINNSGNTTINVSGNNNSVVNSGGITSTPGVDRVRANSATTEVNISGIREMKQIEQSRAAIRGISGPISGSRSSTDDGRKKIDLYRLEFGLTGDDFEEIVNGIGSEEVLKEKFGLTDGDIETIRANWTSALSLSDLARASGRDEIDVKFMEEYDSLMKDVLKKIQKQRERAEKSTYQQKAIIDRKIDNMLTEYRQKREAEGLLPSKKVEDAIREYHRDKLQDVLEIIDQRLQNRVNLLMEDFNKDAGMTFLKIYAEAGRLPQESIAPFIRDFGLLGGTSSEPLSTAIFDLGLPDDMYQDIFDQLDRDIASAFSKDRDLDGLVEKYGGDVGARNYILDTLKRTVFVADILGTTPQDLEEWNKSDLTAMDTWGEMPSDIGGLSRIDPEQIRFIPFEIYAQGMNLPKDEFHITELSESYIGALIRAYDRVIEDGRDIPGLMESGEPTEEFRNMYINALRTTLMAHMENITNQLKSVSGEIEFEEKGDLAILGQALMDVWDNYPHNEDRLNVIEEISGLNRYEIVNAFGEYLDNYYDAPSNWDGLDVDAMFEEFSRELREYTENPLKMMFRDIHSEEPRVEFLDQRIGSFFGSGLGFEDIKLMTKIPLYEIIPMILEKSSFQRYVSLFAQVGQTFGGEWIDKMFLDVIRKGTGAGPWPTDKIARLFEIDEALMEQLFAYLQSKYGS